MCFFTMGTCFFADTIFAEVSTGSKSCAQVIVLTLAVFVVVLGLSRYYFDGVVGCAWPKVHNFAVAKPELCECIFPADIIHQ